MTIQEYTEKMKSSISLFVRPVSAAGLETMNAIDECEPNAFIDAARRKKMVSLIFLFDKGHFSFAAEMMASVKDLEMNPAANNNKFFNKMLSFFEGSVMCLSKEVKDADKRCLDRIYNQTQITNLDFYLSCICHLMVNVGIERQRYMDSTIPLKYIISGDALFDSVCDGLDSTNKFIELWGQQKPDISSEAIQ